MKCRQPRLGLELVLLTTFPSTITISLSSIITNILKYQLGSIECHILFTYKNIHDIFVQNLELHRTPPTPTNQCLVSIIPNLKNHFPNYKSLKLATYGPQPEIISPAVPKKKCHINLLKLAYFLGITFI